MWKYQSWDSTVPTVVSYALSIVWAHFSRQGINPKNIQARCVGVASMSFRIWQLSDRVSSYFDLPKNLSSAPCLMQKWLAQSPIWYAVDPVCYISNWKCSWHCRFNNPRGQQDALVHYQTPPEIRDVGKRSGYSWKYPSSIMFWSDVSDLQSNKYRWAQNQVPREPFAGYLLIRLIRFCSCPVYARDVTLFRVSFTG